MKKAAIQTAIFLLAFAIFISPVAAALATVSIPDVGIEEGESSTVSIIIENSTDIKGAHILLAYDPSVVSVTAIGNSDFNFETYKDIDNSAGFTRYAVVNTEEGLTNNTTFADVTLKAVGNAGETSLLGLDVISLDNGSGPESIARIDIDGKFTITGEQASSPPSGMALGGGGGGGFAPLKGNVPTDTTGKVTSTATIYSSDGKTMLTIPEGTTTLDAEGKPLSSISVSSTRVGGTIYAYDFAPDGATFDPEITITFKFDQGEVSEGETVIIKVWDGTEWIPLETTVDSSENTATTTISHFTVFALFVEEETAAIPPRSPTATPAPTPTTTTIATHTPTPPASWILLSGVVLVIGGSMALPYIVNRRDKR
ncbi:MAG: cohesin domain-containing protein [Halobacteriota archaeon]|nr:cohesin domain-containing protein [Halobacteriota archaeon]